MLSRAFHARAGALLLVFLLSGCAETRHASIFGPLPVIRDAAGAYESTALSPPPAPLPAPDAPVSAAALPAASAATAAPGATALPADFWQRLRAGFVIPNLPPQYTAALNSTYGARPDFMMRTLQRGAPYLPFIAAQLQQAGLPADLAMLPVIESAFDTRALSSAAASGIWQFIPETGRRYGLQKTWLRDERRDPLTATNAALRYLGDLYRQFGDWHLALAAYNCGEGCVARAVSQAAAAGRSRDFVGIQPFLPAETRSYVPRFIAVRNIVFNADAYGVHLPSLNHAPRVVRYALGRDADLASVARLAGMPLAELSALNAGVLRQVLAASDAVLWLPEPHAARLNTSLAAPHAAALQFKPSQARPQEKLAAFAVRHGTSVEALREVNGISGSLHTIQSGTLFVPLQPGEVGVPLQPGSWPALHMQGEEALLPKPFAGTQRDQALLAAHPQWVESGWTPNRLQLPGRRKR